MLGSTFESGRLVIDTDEGGDKFSQMRVDREERRPVVDVPVPHRTRRVDISGDDASRRIHLGSPYTEDTAMNAHELTTFKGAAA